MTQQKSILDILKETGLTQGRTSKTLIEITIKLTLKEDDPKTEIHSYQKLIGKLLYLAHTHPDISYSIDVLSQFMHSPRRTQYQAALRILRYLKVTIGLALTFKRTWWIFG